MVTIFVFHNSQDFTNFKNLIFLSKRNASADLIEDILSALQIFDKGKPFRDLNKVDSFMVNNRSKKDIIILGSSSSSEKIASDFNTARQFMYGDLDFLKRVILNVRNSYISNHNNTAWFSATGYYQTHFDGFILPIRYNAIITIHADIWKIHKSQWDWFYNTNFLIDKVLFSVIFTIICLFLLIVRITVITISWKKNRKKNQILESSSPNTVANAYVGV